MQLGVGGSAEKNKYQLELYQVSMTLLSLICVFNLKSIII